MAGTLVLIVSKPGAVKDIYREVERIDEVLDAKMVAGAHDVLTVTKSREEKFSKNLENKIKSIEGVQDTILIEGIADSFANNLIQNKPLKSNS